MVHYLASTNTNVTVGILLPRGVEGSLKDVKVPQKNKKIQQPKPIQEHVEEEVAKEAIPSKTGILKHTKKQAKRPQYSPIRPSVPKVEVKTPTKSQQTHSSSKGIKKIHKPQITNDV